MKKQWILMSLVAASAGLGAASAHATTLYEQSVILNCSGTSCGNNAPSVPAGKVLTVNTISCQINNGTSGTYGAGELWTSGSSFRQYFAANVVAGLITIAPVQNVAKRFTAGQYPMVLLTFGSTQSRSGQCMLRGSTVP